MSTDIELDLNDLNETAGGSQFTRGTLEELEQDPCFESMKSKLSELKKQGLSKEDAFMPRVDYIFFKQNLTPYSRNEGFSEQVLGYRLTGRISYLQKHLFDAIIG